MIVFGSVMKVVDWPANATVRLKTNITTEELWACSISEITILCSFVAKPFADLRYNTRFEICVKTNLLRRFFDFTPRACRHVLLRVSLQLGSAPRVGEPPHQVRNEANSGHCAQLCIELFAICLCEFPR